MDTGVKGRRSYKDKLKLKTKPRMQTTDLLNTEMSKCVRNYKPVESSEARKDGEEGKIVEISKSDETPPITNFEMEQDSGPHSSVKYIQHLLDDVLRSVVNLATDDNGIRQESKHIDAKELEEGEIK